MDKNSWTVTWSPRLCIFWFWKRLFLQPLPYCRVNNWTMTWSPRLCISDLWSLPPTFQVSALGLSAAATEARRRRATRSPKAENSFNPGHPPPPSSLPPSYSGSTFHPWAGLQGTVLGSRSGGATLLGHAQLFWSGGSLYLASANLLKRFSWYSHLHLQTNTHILELASSDCQLGLLLFISLFMCQTWSPSAEYAKVNSVWNQTN